MLRTARAIAKHKAVLARKAAKHKAVLARKAARLLAKAQGKHGKHGVQHPVQRHAAEDAAVRRAIREQGGRLY